MHLHRAVGFDSNVWIRKVDFLSSVSIDLEHFPKHVALVVLLFLNLLLASFDGGYGGVFNVLDCPQGPTNGWREQNRGYNVQSIQVRGHSTADSEGRKQRVYSFHIVTDVFAFAHEAKHLAVEEFTKYVKCVPAGQIRLLPRFNPGRERDPDGQASGARIRLHVNPKTQIDHRLLLCKVAHGLAKELRA